MTVADMLAEGVEVDESRPLVTVTVSTPWSLTHHTGGVVVAVLALTLFLGVVLGRAWEAGARANFASQCENDPAYCSSRGFIR